MNDSWYYVFANMDNTKVFKPIAAFVSFNDAVEYFQNPGNEYPAYIVIDNQIQMHRRMGDRL